MLKFYIENGELCLDSGLGFEIASVTAYLEWAGNHYDTIIKRSDKWRVENGLDTAVATDGVFTIRAEVKNGGLYVRGGVIVPKEAGALVNFCPLKGVIKNGGFKTALVNEGFWINDVIIDFMHSEVGVEGFIKGEVKRSPDYAVATVEDGAFCFGAVNYDDRFAQINLCENGEVETVTPVFTRKYNGGEEFLSGNFIIAKASGISVALEKYAEALSENNSRGKTDNIARSGWCSWYYYGTKISEKIVLDNLAEAKRLGLNLDIFQIDDGWNISRGDWDANEKFPRGMKFLADEIKKAGFIPGIWVAPLTAEKNSEFFKNNQDLFVKGLYDNEVFGNISLDLSNEKAQKWLYDLFYKLSHEWGYRYIKFDFAFYGISGGKHLNERFNGMQNYSEALKIMRSAVTSDTLLLACGAPLSPSVGKADVLRVGRDIYEDWQSVKTNAKQIILRSFLNKGIRIDPDCVIAHEKGSEDGEAFRFYTRTEGENKTLISLTAACGGNVMFSDKLSLLSDEKIELIKKMLPVNQKTALAFDLGVRDIPSVLINDSGVRGVKTVTLINWGDYPKVITHELDKQYSAFDFWQQKPLGKLKTLSFNIPAHECKVIHLTCDLPIIGFYDRIIPDVKLDILDEFGNEFSLKGLKAGEKLLLNGDFLVESLSGGKIDGQTVTADGGDLKIAAKSVR